MIFFSLVSSQLVDPQEAQESFAALLPERLGSCSMLPTTNLNLKSGSIITTTPDSVVTVERT